MYFLSWLSFWIRHLLTELQFTKYLTCSSRWSVCELTCMACCSRVASTTAIAAECIPRLGAFPSMLTVVGNTPVLTHGSRKIMWSRQELCSFQIIRGDAGSQRSNQVLSLKPPGDQVLTKISQICIFTVFLRNIPVYNCTHIQANIFEGSNVTLLHSPQVHQVVIYVDHLNAALERAL